MESYIKITTLNDFMFCPLSIYYHNLYGQLDALLYKDTPQLDGEASHETIEEGTYSTHKDILQGMDVYSEEYMLCGKIDIFNVSTETLTERKKKVKAIYDGNLFQLYAQCIALREMGYTVKHIRFYSKEDNKIYPQTLPEDNPAMMEKFRETIVAMQTFDPADYRPNSPEKCRNCIYSTFCDRPLS